MSLELELWRPDELRGWNLADALMLVDVPKLLRPTTSSTPDPSIPEQRVVFGTSSHRGSALNCAFDEAHILATAQAICDYRQRHRITGPLFLGKDTHALSEPALSSGGKQ
jgi:phosphoglucomutase